MGRKRLYNNFDVLFRLMTTLMRRRTTLRAVAIDVTSGVRVKSQKKIDPFLHFWPVSVETSRFLDLMLDNAKRSTTPSCGTACHHR